MSHSTPRFILFLGLGLLVTACGGGGGGGSGGGGGGNNNTGGDSGGGSIGSSKADNEVKTYATVGTDGSYAQVDLINGGNPTSQANFDVASQNFLNMITTTKGADLDNDLANLPGSGATNATGFDTYSPGLAPGGKAQRIVGANNLYDLFQTTTGQPKASLVTNPPPSFVFNGFTGGDIDSSFNGGNAQGDGGAGLLSNVPNSQVPKLPPIPYTMGTLTPSGSGRGPSPTDQHQFIQIVFPYNLDRDSLFNALNSSNSFLGDSDPLAPANVFIEARWVQHPPDDQANAVDQTAQHRHVSGVAVIGGVTAVPYVSGTGTTLATIDANISNVPVGAQALLNAPNVFTYIAHENASLITTGGSANAFGFIDAQGVLILPDPTTSPGGGRVMGCNVVVPGAVNDFAASDDEDAAPMGFVYWKFANLRSKGETIDNPYFHSFPLSQAKVGPDPRAILVPPATVNRTFDRGAAVDIVPTTSVPAIDILDIAKDAITPSTYSLSPSSDADPTQVISTRARFRVDFDKEVVPNSVGMSRHFTIQSTESLGVIFPFNGNTRSIASPAGQLLPATLGSPLAASIYVAINQPAGVNKTTVPPQQTGFLQKVNSPYAKSGFGTKDGGIPFTQAEANGNGLVPTVQNTLATLPRGVVPCDIYPINQNNLQSYVIQPLVEFPPNTVVTVGVCMPGLGMSALSLTNRGNQTRGGTIFTGFQGLTVVGLGDSNTAFKTAIIGNETVIKVNAGPMDLEGLLFYGGTTVAIDTLIDGKMNNNLTTGGSNVCRTFQVGQDNKLLYVNAPVSPQAIYLAYSSGGAGVLDLSGTGYNTNVPGGAQQNLGFKSYIEVSRFLPPTLTGAQSKFNYNPTGSFANGNHFRAFGILGRYTSGGSQGSPPGTESEWAIGAAIPTGSLTPTPGINEGSSGYETMVFSGITENKPSTATAILTSSADVSIVRDMQVGDFLDKVYFDPENAFATAQQHRTYNTPQQGAIVSNTIADPPFPNPPPLRFPVGLPHTAVIFNQEDLTEAPFIIDGNEIYSIDGFGGYDDGSGNGFLTTAQTNGFIQLNPTTNVSNTNSFDIPPLPRAGFNSTFLFATGAASTPKFVQTGPMPKTSTTGAVILTFLNGQAPGTAASGALVAPIYQARQQIGNFLFAADGVNRKVHAINSNTMQVLRSLTLPDPYGLGLSPDLDRLYVSNEGDNSLSIVDADPTSATFMTELKRVPVGVGPRAVCVDPDNEDVFVLNYLANTVTIVDVNSGTVRKTLSQQGLNRPYEMACGMREAVGGPAFQSGTYHGYISNFGANNVLIFQSGPDGLAGIGFDSIIGQVRPNNPPTSQVFKDMFEPRGIVYDPNAPLDGFSATVGCFVAHKDATGKAVVSRILYTKDALPGQQVFNTNAFIASFGVTVFETTAQYLSTFPAAAAYSVALPDYNRMRFEESDFASYYNLLNAGATTKQVPVVGRNDKFPLADNLLPFFADGPRWDPDRLYLSLSGKLIEVFDISTGSHLKTITTPRDVSVMTTYFSQ